MSDNESNLGVIGWLIWTLTIIIVVSLVAGIAAASIGGSLSDLGSGYGGLYGLPAMLLSALALLVILAAVIVGRSLGPKSGRLRIAILVIAGVWLVAIGYSMVAHMVDPCVNGWWDARSRVGSQRLCERFGSELNWHTRFHLLAHAAPAAVLLGVYMYVIRRWGRPRGIDTDKPPQPVSEPLP
ncbi:MAG: hypothetical protein ACR2PK_14890 [Acidimicrobiales bacterium]